MLSSYYAPENEIGMGKEHKFQLRHKSLPVYKQASIYNCWIGIQETKGKNSGGIKINNN